MTNNNTNLEMENQRLRGLLDGNGIDHTSESTVGNMSRTSEEILNEIRSRNVNQGAQIAKRTNAVNPNRNLF